MNGIQENVKVPRVLEYIIFSGNTLRLLQSEGNLEFEIQPLEICDKHFIAEVLSGPLDLLKEHETGRLSVKTGFKGKFLQFTTKILQFHESACGRTQFSFSMPSTAILTNQRRYPRLKLPNLTESLRAEITLKGISGPKTFTTSRFLDICNQGIAVYIERDQGLILPGDQVTDFKLISGNEVILSTPGKVLRIDINRKSPKMKENFLAVIVFQTVRPTVAHPGDKRRINRSTVMMKPGNFVEFPHPIFGQKTISGYISDISTSGISFVIHETKFPILPGMIINDFSLKFQDEETHSTSVKIANCREIPIEDSLTVRIGAEFVGMSMDMLKSITRTINKTESPELCDAAFEDQELLWEFLFETGFIYMQKRKQIQEYAPKLLETYRKLLQTDGRILKKLLFKENDAIKGHLSAVRFFDHSWVVQHLNALPVNNGSAAQTVFDAMLTFFMDANANEKTGTSHLIWYYQPSNLYSATLFDQIQQVIADREICDSFDLAFCLRRSGEENPPLDDKIMCREAENQDLVDLENTLVAQGYWNDIRLENLTIESFTHLQLSAEYKELELYRYRKVFVAEIPENRARAFAVCNYSSPGLNLSELTNSFRLFFTGSDTDINQALADSLAETVHFSYRDTEMPSPVLLLEDHQPLPFSFRKVKTYRKWFVNAGHMDRFQQAKELIYSDLPKLIKQKMKEDYRRNEAA